MALDLPSVNDTTAVLLVYVIFHAPIFTLSFAIGLRGLGRWTKLAACLITAGDAVGSLLFPFVILAVMQARTARYSLCVVVALYAARTLFPLYLNLFRAARHQVDPVALSTTTRQRPSYYEGPMAVGGDSEEIMQPRLPGPRGSVY
jgi:hypothetical protein